jgi:hypothetical protein
MGFALALLDRSHNGILQSLIIKSIGLKGLNFDRVPTGINITSSIKSGKECVRRIFMAGGNGLAIGLMVIGFIVLFLVPLAFLTSLYNVP